MNATDTANEQAKDRRIKARMRRRQRRNESARAMTAAIRELCGTSAAAARRDGSV